MLDVKGDTRTKLLDTAQRLVQTRGYNAFSFKDLAREVGIRTASIHYHFPKKGDLGVALMQRYLDELASTLGQIERAQGGARRTLERFIDLYRSTESRGAICLCGSLASDRETLTPELQAVVARYLERSERWVTKMVERGVESGEFSYAGAPADAAALLLSGLQGGLIVARGRAGGPKLDAVERPFFQLLGAA